MRRNGAVAAWLIVSAIRICWHLPLMLSGELPWEVGILGNAGFQLIVIALMHRSKGGWTLAVIWHATLNSVSGLFVFTMVTGQDFDRLGVLLAVTYGLLALAVLPYLRRIDQASSRNISPLPYASVPG